MQDSFTKGLLVCSPEFIVLNTGGGLKDAQAQGF